MLEMSKNLSHHITRPDWLVTSKGEPRGYIQPEKLTELWFHTGTRCNLACSFCLEGASPRDNRLSEPTLADLKPFIVEAADVGVSQLSFTGGEPFVNKEFPDILGLALEHADCLVLTNGTKPFRDNIKAVEQMAEQANSLRFRISLDSPDPEEHDRFRGSGMFEMALQTMVRLDKSGFGLSIARHMRPGEDRNEVENQYRAHLRRVGLPEDMKMIAFPDLAAPGAEVSHPEITENCMTTYHTESGRSQFMCSFSKMVLRKESRMRIYACTLVDDDEDYDLGDDLSASMKSRIMLRHHRCFACFSQGTSCSE